MRVVPAVGVLVTGLALYLSRGVLDQVANGGGLSRVALLPPWSALASFLAMAAIGLVWLDRRAAPRGTAVVDAGPLLGPLVLPVLGLALLLLPYLPVLPDALPALQIFAGPARGVIWLLVLVQFAWVLWQSRLLHADRLQRVPLTQVALAVAIATASVSGLAAVRLTNTVLFPNGDEPHYLVIAQSLWRDGDLKIENNHTRLDYKEYFAPDLEPHYLTRGADNEIYSIHPIGMPALIAPVYAVGGYPAVVLSFVVMAAAAAAVMWAATAVFAGAAGAATFAWAAIALTTPFLFNSFAIYPEIPAALAVAVAFTRAVSAGGDLSWTRWLVVGLMSAALPWLSTKYAPMSAALVAMAAARLVWPVSTGTLHAVRWRPDLTRPGVIVALIALVAPYVVSLVGWFWFFYAIWGIPWPQAPYGALVQTELKNLIFAALLATVGAFRIWWGGTASPGRPVTSGLLLLAMPMAFAFRTAPAASARRAAHLLLLSVSLGFAGVLLLAQDGRLLANGRDGTSEMLAYLSARWPAWSSVPSFIYHEAPTAYLATAIWLTFAAAAAFVLTRVQTTRAGIASLTAMATAAAAGMGAALVVALVPVSPTWPSIDVRARPRAALLEEYDSRARPIGLEYTPLRIVSAASIPPHMALEVLPGSRAEPQPLRVLHNGRVSLPAGRYRLEVQWSGARSGESLGLQIGRLGEPWRTWSVEPRPGERWSVDLTIPIDAGFVGLRGTPELERVIGRIAFVPIAVSDEADRPRLPPVMSATSVANGDYFFTDENILAEKLGFWVRGGRKATVSIYRHNAAGPLLLRLNSGLILNRLRLSTSGWSKTIVLEPRQPTDVAIPVEGRSLVTLDLAAEFEFVPRDLDPTSTDPRPLGVWVELVTP